MAVDGLARRGASLRCLRIQGLDRVRGTRVLSQLMIHLGHSELVLLGTFCCLLPSFGHNLGGRIAMTARSKTKCCHVLFFLAADTDASLLPLYSTMTAARPTRTKNF